MRSTGMSDRFMLEHPELTFLYEAIDRLNGPRRARTILDDDVMIQPREFAGYRTPTLIMGGRHDHFLTPEHHLHIASLVPGATSHTFENAGHSDYFEEPQESNHVVAGFLDSHAG
ncbi:MAG: alpha/beta fold hydrolase [Betaproteobacteria bacterium]|nr:alpha/beta fold hydrolase [Betaproteobacteria bacterium]